MADQTKIKEEENPKKRSKKGLLMGFIGATILGAGGFYASYSGIILPDKVKSDSEILTNSAGTSNHNTAEPVAAGDLPDLLFIEMVPLVISLGDGANAKYLRLTAQLDVVPEYAAEITLVMPRIQDVLNTYLRAVSEEELAKPSAFERLRAQMLRRIQVVTGQGKVRDLLITEFVLG